MMNIMAWTGYWVGLGIELGVIVIAGTLLVLMLTGVLFIWIEKFMVWVERKKEENKQKKAEKKARAEAEAAARAEAEAKKAEEEAAAALAEAEKEGEESKEEAAEEKAEAKAEEKPEEETKAEDKKATEEKSEEEEKSKGKKKKSKKVEEEKAEESEEAEEKSEAAAESESSGDSESTVIHDGVVFNETKSITELYDELSAEQKGFFDELREAALAKPDTELAMSKSFITVKIGKRNLIKLLIKRGVTVAEFQIENEALKQLRLSNTNKRGKSTIKVKPTVVSVLDVASLQVAIDMINLSYEEIVLAD